MLQKTRGIVLSHINYSETSIICKIYTEELGLRTYIVNSVRTQKPKHNAVFFQALTMLNMVVYEREQKDIQRIKEYQAIKVFQSIPFDIYKSSIALFITEVLDKTIKEEESNPALFNFLFHLIDYLEETEQGLGKLPVFFLLELSKYLGFYPNNNYTEELHTFDLQEGSFTYSLAENNTLLMDKEASQLLHSLLNLDQAAFFDAPIERNKRRQLLRWLIRYYGLHTSNFDSLKSLEVLEAVLE